MKNMKLKVNEIFVSLQGEGAMTGQACVFVRLAGCNLVCTFCDTKHTEYTEMTLQQIYDEIMRIGHKYLWIVWTGGEPTIQLTFEVIQFFKEKGFKQAIETNGTLPIPEGLDYITVSPKGKLGRQYVCTDIQKINEYRIPCTFEDLKNSEFLLPYNGGPPADSYYISPIINEGEIPYDEIRAISELIIREYPQWRLSVQTHKLIGLP